MSKKVCAETVVAPAWLTFAGTVSSTWRSRSVAIRRSDPSSRASIRTFDRIGIVFLRSTTDWTWPRLLRRVARSIVAFMSPQPHHPRTNGAGYSEPFGARKYNDEQSLYWVRIMRRPQYVAATCRPFDQRRVLFQASGASEWHR